MFTVFDSKWESYLYTQTKYQVFLSPIRIEYSFDKLSKMLSTWKCKQAYEKLSRALDQIDEDIKIS